MQQYSVSIKIFLSILAFGFILWIGGSILRTAIAFDLFVPGTALVLKSYYSNAIQMHSVYIYSMLSFYTGVGFGIAFISAIILNIKFRKIIRKRGWLFMAFILFYFSSIAAGFLIYQDIRLAMDISWYHVNEFSSETVQKYVINRFKYLPISSAYWLSLLSSLTALFYIIWRPLDKE
jgi:hypothetical protein